MDYDYIYKVEEYYNNLRMFKYVHDAGIPIQQFERSCSVTGTNVYGQPSMNSMSNFLSILFSVFTILETYDGYDSEETNDMNYWIDTFNLDLDYDIYSTTAAYLILDDDIQPFENRQGVGYNPLTDGSCEIFHIERGMLIIFDLDYGEPDFSEVMFWILRICKNKFLGSVII